MDFAPGKNFDSFRLLSRASLVPGARFRDGERERPGARAGATDRGTKNGEGGEAAHAAMFAAIRAAIRSP